MRTAWVLVDSGSLIAEHDSGLVVPWWSFTKTVLSAAILVLVRDGKAALDEKLEGKPYTLRQLLQHRSGLANYGGLRAYHEAVERGDFPWPAADLWDRCDADRLRFAPGVGWEYSNLGYWMVRCRIEALTGLPLGVALRRLVLDPLGIRSARLAEEPGDLAHVEMGQARGYHPGWVYHGLLVGTLADAALLLDRLLAGSLLPADLIKAMATAVRLPGPVPGRPWSEPGYGLGVMRGRAADRSVVGHTGGGPGSTIAVYHTLDRRRRTAAVFRSAEDQGATEESVFGLMAE